MGAVIGDLLPLAVTIAISPVPIIAVILMLLAPKAGSTSFGFLLGWVVGIAFATALFAWLAAAGLGSADETTTGVSWIKLLLGVVLLILAAKQWRSRPAPGEVTPLPRWMTAIDRFTPIKAAGLGFALAAVNPKNLMMCVSAGLTLGAGGLGVGEQIAAGAIFTVLAASTIAVPVIAYAVASERMRGPLGRLKTWLQAENATVMGVLLLVIGVVLIGKSFGGLF